MAAADEQEEVERLRARLEELERERFELAARTNARVAAGRIAPTGSIAGALNLDAALRHRVVRAALAPWRR